MDIGVSIPHYGPLASPALVPAFCRRAEEAGFDGLWVAEHLVVPQQSASTYTLARRPVVTSGDTVRATMGLSLEMITTLSVAAAVTSRVKLATGVAVLPLRNPIVNARQLATLDLYSGGRLLYGVGVGWLQEEAEALGMPWDRRGARSEEHIQILRRLWTATEDWVGFEGPFTSFAPIDPRPQPAHAIPVLIGGHSDVAIDRAARIGDGWVGANMGPDRLGEALAQLSAACERHGRAFSELMIVCSTMIRFGDGDDPAAVASEVKRYADLGVAHLQVRVDRSNERDTLDALSRWGDEVLPRVR